tara:strand:- start:162 stop:425 length:264 start_codon:yes stop_codon:yes gene_type:complete
VRKLRDAFVETDEDGSGDISKDEFDILMGKYTELTCAPSSSPSVFILACSTLSFSFPAFCSPHPSLDCVFSSVLIFENGFADVLLSR